MHDIGMRLQELEHETVGKQTIGIHRIEQGVMPERRPAFIHDLRLALRVEILRDLAHDAHDLTLPWLEQRRVLLDEVEHILLWLGRKATLRFFGQLAAPARQCPPKIVDLLLEIRFAFLPPRLLLR